MTGLDLDSFKQKSVHIVGVSGSEGSAVLSYLVKQGFGSLVLHDSVEEAEMEKNYKTWHKGATTEERNVHYQEFLKNCKAHSLYTGKNYLKEILTADLIFAPQSWRLYPDQNKNLMIAYEKGIPFYSLTKTYLSQTKAMTIGVTGTVGKGSTSRLIYQGLINASKKAYLGGNDTWAIQVLDKINEMKQDEYLVLEISHRQLRDGVDKAPHIGVFTNIYPNHLDEVTLDDYKKLKYSLFLNQTENDYSILNSESPEQLELSAHLKSQVIWYSAKIKNKNSENIQKVFDHFNSNKSQHFFENILAAATALNVLGINSETIIKSIEDTQTLPARIQKMGEIKGVEIYDDIKSTTPWATAALSEKLGKNTILILGGHTKGIPYETFFKSIKGKVKNVIFLKSELSKEAMAILGKEILICESLKEAIEKALTLSTPGDTIAVSPAAAFFYTEFIKGKQSIRKIISLLQEEKE